MTWHFPSLLFSLNRIKNILTYISKRCFTTLDLIDDSHALENVVLYVSAFLFT